MKLFLHLSTWFVIAVLTALAERFHGLPVALGVCVACAYIGAAQWTDGRFCR